MNEKTKILISIGAATAANCIPCFEHLYFKAHNMKIDDSEIKETVDIAIKVKNGANIAIKSAITDIMNDTYKVANPAKCPCDCN